MAVLKSHQMHIWGCVIVNFCSWKLSVWNNKASDSFISYFRFLIVEMCRLFESWWKVSSKTIAAPGRGRGGAVHACVTGGWARRSCGTGREPRTCRRRGTHGRTLGGQWTGGKVGPMVLCGGMVPRSVPRLSTCDRYWIALCYTSVATFHDLSKCVMNVYYIKHRQNDRHFADDILKCVFLIENVWVVDWDFTKFVGKSPSEQLVPIGSDNDLALLLELKRLWFSRKLLDPTWQNCNVKKHLCIYEYSQQYV